MARVREKLTARDAATSKPGRYGDVGGLYLIVSETGAGKWVFRFTFAGKVTEMGPGSAAEWVGLGDARASAGAGARCCIKAKSDKADLRPNGRRTPAIDAIRAA
jgi:hypothetical protein